MSATDVTWKARALAAERAWAEVTEAAARALKERNEACAQVCDELRSHVEREISMGDRRSSRGELPLIERLQDMGAIEGMADCAAAIRARVFQIGVSRVTADVDAAGRALQCVECGEPLPDPRGKRGRPLMTCSDDCRNDRRQRAKRDRYAEVSE